MKLTTIMIAVLLATSCCYALTISPASRTIDTAGLHEFTVHVRNQGEEGVVAIRAEGDLAEHVTFEQSSAPFTQDVIFHGTIDVPSDITPGDHGQHLVVSLTAPQEGVLAAAVETVSLLTVRKAYDGAYLVGDVYASADQGNERAMVYITLENRGNAPVNPVVSMQWRNGTISVPSEQIPVRSSIQLQATIAGRGQETLVINVEGAQGLRNELLVTLGKPHIAFFSAKAVPEQGNITPVQVDAQIDWNVPIDATLTINGVSQPLKIDRQYSGRVYVETNESSAAIALHVGDEVRELNVSLRPSTAQQSGDWRIPVLIVLLLVLIVALIYGLRKRNM